MSKLITPLKFVLISMIGLIVSLSLMSITSPDSYAQIQSYWSGEAKVPTWKGVITGAGVTPTYKVAPGDNRLSFLQLMETSSWKGSFWGVTFAGDTVQICPTFSTDGDTSITPSVNASFVFDPIKVEWIQTHSGTATFWGE